MTLKGTRILMVVALVALVAGCGGRQVYRLDEEDTAPDLSGRWNSVDSASA